MLMLVAVACSKSTDDSSSITPSTVKSPYDGNTYYQIRTVNGSTDTLVLGMKFSSGGVTVFTARVPLSTGTASYQKSIGTYEISGSNYIFHYSYETCKPVQTETFEIKSSDPADSISIRPVNGNITYILRNDLKYSPASYGISQSLSNLSVMVEDKSCTMISLKDNSTAKRVPANYLNTIEAFLKNTKEKH